MRHVLYITCFSVTFLHNTITSFQCWNFLNQLRVCRIQGWLLDLGLCYIQFTIMLVYNLKDFKTVTIALHRSQLPCSLRRRDHRFESRLQHVCLSLCLYVILSFVTWGLCDELMTHPKESYRVSHTIRETSERKPWPDLGWCTIGEEKNKQ
jgi:hypothetical protein